MARLALRIQAPTPPVMSKGTGCGQPLSRALGCKLEDASILQRFAMSQIGRASSLAATNRMANDLSVRCSGATVPDLRTCLSLGRFPGWWLLYGLSSTCFRFVHLRKLLSRLPGGTLGILLRAPLVGQLLPLVGQLLERVLRLALGALLGLPLPRQLRHRV